MQSYRVNRAELHKMPALILFSALISSCGVLRYLASYTAQKSIQGSLVLPILCFAFFFLWKRIFITKHTVRYLFSSVVLSVVFSLFMSLGTQFIWQDKSVCLRLVLENILLYAFSFFPLILCILELMSEWGGTDCPARKKYVYLAFILICIVWFATWLALWPGIYEADSPEWYRAISRGILQSKWSIPYQALFYLFVHTSWSITGTYELGFATLTLLQLAFVLYVVWRILNFLNTRMGYRVLGLSTGFFCLNLGLAIISISVLQDTPFMAAFAMCIMLFFIATNEPEKFWQSWQYPARTVCWILFLCLCRNNGFYALVFVLVMLAFVSPKVWRLKLFSIVSLACVAYLLFHGPILSSMGAKKDTTITEMMSVPATQLARVWNYEKDSLSEKELQQLYTYMPESFLTSHNYFRDNRISDQYKAHLNTELIGANPQSFIGYWANLGLKYPRSYILAHLELTYGLWYPDIKYYDAKMAHAYIDYANFSLPGSDYITIERQSKFPLYKQMLDKLFGDKVFPKDEQRWKMPYAHTPLLAQICKSGLYVWALLLVLAHTICEQKKQIAVPLTLCLGLLITLMLGPVVLFRYMSPLIFSAPVWVCLSGLTRKTS